VGETCDEDQYPTYWKSRLKSFFDRSGRADCIGTMPREGALTILGTLCCGDFESSPVIKHTLDIVDVFWGFDVALHRKKHFPAVNWLTSFSKSGPALQAALASFDVEFEKNVLVINDILAAERDLLERVQTSGRDSLSEDQKCTLAMAKLIREDFLQQNCFLEHECPLAKTIGMMQIIVAFRSAAQKAIAESTVEATVTWDMIFNSLRELLTQICAMKFELPNQSDVHFKQFFNNLNAKVEHAFHALADEKVSTS